MAECKTHFIYTDQSVESLIDCLSATRYETYRRKAGYDREFAFQLYLYNARLSKALLFPLHVVEIVLRNAIDELLSSLFCREWHESESLLDMLSPESLANLDKAIGRSTKSGKACKDDVVARLTFDFWSNLFRAEYDRSLWQRNMHHLLPAAPTTRAKFQPQVARINQLRNRIAHHEPIFVEDVSQRFKEIVDVVASRSATAGDWLKDHSTVHLALRSKPTGSASPGPDLADRCDPAFHLVQGTTTLRSLKMTGPGAFLVQVDAAGLPRAVLDESIVGRYLLQNADETGLVDLQEHCIADVVEWSSAGASLITLPGNAGLGVLPRDLKRGRHALVVDPRDPRTVLGVIAKAHRRY